MDISTIGRPRNVGWLRAAALLYGDWGTSKAYVVGLAIASIGFAALPHLLAVCALTALVGVNYIWVCKYFPSGGGVYAAAGLHSPRLAMVGGLLLLADYIVTASLSCLDAFHYLGFNDTDSKKWAITAIFAIGVVNFFGPKHTGSLAIWLALPTVLVVLALIVGGTTHLGDFSPLPTTGGIGHNWIAFVGMILALSGVEAAASNTGVLRLDPGATYERPSVHRTSRRAVTIVMIEVVLGTGLLSILAMCLPNAAIDHKEDLLRYMGEVFIGPDFARVVGAVFALLLLSAVNTALSGMISLLYVMARDQELPEHFTELNNFGVPWLALIFATVLPVLVLNLDDSVEGLAALYAIGVVGAITINLGSCVFAKQLPLRKGERRTMAVTSFILAAVWITIAVTKLGALAFVVAVLIAGLTVRELTQRRLRRRAERAPAASPSTTLTVAPNGKDAPPVLGTRILVAARGWTPALQFALEAARLRGASLLVLYIREVNVLIEYSANWKDDPQARKLFHRITAAVPDLQINPLYSVSDSPADTITDIAATFAVDTVILGGSKRATLVNLLRGNVVTRVASNLPDSIRLVVIG